LKMAGAGGGNCPRNRSGFCGMIRDIGGRCGSCRWQAKRLNHDFFLIGAPFQRRPSPSFQAARRRFDPGRPLFPLARRRWDLLVDWFVHPLSDAGCSAPLVRLAIGTSLRIEYAYVPRRRVPLAAELDHVADVRVPRVVEQPRLSASNLATKADPALSSHRTTREHTWCPSHFPDRDTLLQRHVSGYPSVIWAEDIQRRGGTIQPAPTC